MVGGVYRFGFQAVEAGWSIDELALRASWVDGDQAVITAVPR